MGAPPRTAKEALAQGNYKRSRARRWTCTFEYMDKEGIKRFGKGRTFAIDGQDVDLFPSGVLCGMMGYSDDTLRGWEEHRGFPKAMYRVEDDGRKNRWYSRKQLIAIRTIAEQFNYARGKHRDKLDVMIAAIRRVFWHVDLPLEKRNAGGHDQPAALQDGERDAGDRRDGGAELLPGERREVRIARREEGRPGDGDRGSQESDVVSQEGVQANGDLR